MNGQPYAADEGVPAGTVYAIALGVPAGTFLAIARSVPAGTRTATSRVARGGWKADKAHRSVAEGDADMIPYVCFQHGMYMSVRGWLRVGHKRRDAVASR